MRFFSVIFTCFSFVLSTPLAAAEKLTKPAPETALEELLAIKLKLDYMTFNGVNFNQGGGYDLGHRKLEIGNFLVHFSHENFEVDWDDIEQVDFIKHASPTLSHMQRYHLQGHIPYRLDNNRMWLVHMGAEWAFEEEIQDSVSLQSYLLYSHKINAKGSWQVGAYVNYHPVEVVVLPIFEYTYNVPFVEHKGYYGHIGFPKTLLGYHLTSKLRTEFGLVYHQAIAKLAEDSAIETGGFFQTKNWRAAWQWHYRANKKLAIRIGAQANLANKLVLFDREYNMVEHYYGDGGVGWIVGLTYRF